MGFWNTLLGRNIPHVMNTPRVTYLGGSPLDVSQALDPTAWTATYMWRHQPHLRTVVSFRARNVAQLGLHVFRRVSDTDRERDTSSILARALRRPDQMVTYYDLMFSLVGDLDLYDRAYWMVTADRGTGDPVLRRLPPAWVHPNWKNPWEVKSYSVLLGDKQADVPPEQIIPFGGYAPDAVHGHSAAIDALKATLQEQIEAAGYRMQVWKRGGRASAVIERPKDAPQWSAENADRFKDDWYANFTGDGPRAGGTPVLEDGMTIKQIDMNAREQQFVEAQRLHMQTVAAAYHVNPTMVGDNSGANYSNVREFRKMLYGDSLGPTLAQIENAVNAFLIPALGMDPAEHYAEFNVQQKLQGSFEEQARVMQTMTGRPIMTLNEARARFNLPAIDEDYGDEVVTPLNVVSGDQASPTDSGSQNIVDDENNDLEQRSGRVLFKAAEPTSFTPRLQEMFARTFERQREAVKTQLGLKSEDWWDTDRWDRELSDDLMRASVDITLEAATRVLAEIGEPPTAYNVNRTRAYLVARSDGSAQDMNAATRDAVADLLEDGGSVDEVDHYFDVAETSRAETSAIGAAAALTGFASVEAARQARPNDTMKRWVTNSGNPRETHAAMNGETVPIDGVFSNNLPHPGAWGAGPGESAGCQCSIQIVTSN